MSTEPREQRDGLSCNCTCLNIFEETPWNYDIGHDINFVGDLSEGVAISVLPHHMHHTSNDPLALPSGSVMVGRPLGLLPTGIRLGAL